MYNFTMDIQGVLILQTLDSLKCKSELSVGECGRVSRIRKKRSLGVNKGKRNVSMT